jgi:hypothetical protein
MRRWAGHIAPIRGDEKFTQHFRWEITGEMQAYCELNVKTELDREDVH